MRENTEKLNQLIQEIWKSANSLRGKFKSYEYQNIVLPMITIRRIECVLQKWRDDEKIKTQRGLPDATPEKISEIMKIKEKGFAFHNSTDWSLRGLLNEDSTQLEENFRAYLKGFSPNIEIIIDHFNFRETVGKLSKSERLGTIVSQYADEDLSLERLDNHEMGYVYEELLRRFSEQSGEEAGEHFTPREVIHLMVELLDMQFHKDATALSIYDPACGTGGMLSVAKTHLLNSLESDKERAEHSGKVTLFGQELQPHNFAVCQAEMLLKADRSFIYLGNSLIPYNEGRKDKGDQLDKTENKFDYMLSNPPFGVTWSDYKTEAEKLNSTRYSAGMPRSNDGAFLFLQTMLAKMKNVEKGGSKIAVVFNGSPLSNGDCGSGESEIRRWIIENDWLDAIVMLPDQLFYNTGIFTYIWLLSNNKPESHKGKIKIIDARDQFEKEPKSFGNKRNRMTDSHRAWINDAYQKNWEHPRHNIKLFSPQDFAYHKVSVVFWQTDEHDQPAFIHEPYEKPLTPFNVKKEQAFYDSEISFEFIASYEDQVRKIHLTVQKDDVFSNVYNAELKVVFFEKLMTFISLAENEKDKPRLETLFFKFVNVNQVYFKHRHYVQDNEYIPHGQDIQAFLEREIAKPIIRWQDSEQLGYEILPNKYFYHYQAPKPTAELLNDFWTLEKTAVDLIKSLED